MQKAEENEIVQCPFDKKHLLLKSRLAAHLIKCRISHPDAKLNACPFNTTHLLSKYEYVAHVINCPDRKIMFQYGLTPSPAEWENTHSIIETDENWDEVDAEDYDPKKYLDRVAVLRRAEDSASSIIIVYYGLRDELTTAAGVTKTRNHIRFGVLVMKFGSIEETND
uniref:CHHC U11-48K-type domain-containing protein n=1 Tax=Glossina austeni TaxID=7395 RepID=A0A1A9UL09_GLOAU